MTALQKKRAAQRKGRIAEILALLLFLLRGFWPLARRYKTKVGEIDLILRRGSLLVFAEVKMRSDPDAALFALSPKQRRRIENAARFYLARHPRFQNMNLRFDVIFFTPRPRHISDAFRPSRDKMW